MDLPVYIAIDRKPEDGCEIQNACCGKSSTMMQLKLVWTSAGENAVAQQHQQQQQKIVAIMLQCCTLSWFGHKQVKRLLQIRNPECLLW